MASTDSTAWPRRRSVLQWCAAGLVGLAAATILLAALSSEFPKLPALLLGAVADWALVSVILAVGSRWCIDDSGRLLPSVGVPNGLTAFRAWLTYPLVLATFLPYSRIESLALFASAGFVIGMLDALDGFWARRWGPVTVLGKAIDPGADVIFFTFGSLGCLREGIIPVWLFCFIAIRYLGPFVLTPVVILAGRRPELVHTVWGRRNTLLIGVVLFLCLMARLFGLDVFVVSLIIGIPTLIPTFCLHVVSLWKRVETSSPGRTPA